MKRLRLLFFIWICGFSAGFSQNTTKTLPLTPLPLTDLSAFRPTTANWKIVGNVFANRQIDQALEAFPGTGVLANLSDPQNRGHLFTRLEHGDIELEVDIMMAKGSNSGIYFQGRYELQLQDSWGKREKPKYGDLGGIYQRTDTITNRGFEGSAPRINASKAPGLWQHIRVWFKAPKFDSQGRKIANARFVEVYVNGVLVQQDFEVSGPTRSGAFKDEKPLGPLMIQGNHGRVALKGIAYKRDEGKPLRVTELSFKEYKSPGENFRNQPLTEVGEQKTDTISYHSARQKDIFLLAYQGKLNFPQTGTYLFKLQTGGGGLLIIDKDTVILHDGVHSFDQVAIRSYTAKAGPVPFTLVYNKFIGWRQGLALYVEGPGLTLQPLHTSGSVFHEPPVEPIRIKPDPKQVVLQRSFMDDGETKRTHCVSVATPEGIHYTVDLQEGRLLQVWSGDFLDATPMWNRRGNQQVGIPLGMVLQFATGTDLRTVAGKPVSNDPEQKGAFRFSEYTLDARGLPTFHYTCQQVTVSDQLSPSANERSLHRKVVLNGKVGFQYRLAAGQSIELLPDGSYAIDDKAYYLVLNSPNQKPIIRQTGNTQELLFSATKPGRYEVNYTLTW
ncbi:family 16 glycoside hydrolase [Larkinella bovis]|uniref:Family 16 glycoside hydrolase n=1 Tax=Larkinella bovis TaxID=683041 RepID=A0ABW0IGB7_9BACT